MSSHNITMVLFACFAFGLPLWAMQTVLGAGAYEMLLAVVLFTVIDLLFSRLTRPATAR